VIILTEVELLSTSGTSGLPLCSKLYLYFRCQICKLKLPRTKEVPMIQIFTSFIDPIYSISNFTGIRNILSENSNIFGWILNILCPWTDASLREYTKNLIWKHVNLLHYDCCELRTCFDHLLWSSSEKSFYEGFITKTTKSKHKYKLLNFKYVIQNIC
jgi:hypothetical protein